MSSKAGNLRSNMYFYRQQGSNDEDGKIVLETKGDVGAYNRANRSMHHFSENVPGMLLCFPLAAYVFPFPSTVLMSVYAIGRVMHQTGYTKVQACLCDSVSCMLLLFAIICRGTEDTPWALVLL